MSLNYFGGNHHYLTNAVCWVVDWTQTIPFIGKFMKLIANQVMQWVPIKLVFGEKDQVNVL